MNLSQIDDQLRDSILERESGIAFFVFEKKYYWLIDWREHFNLNQQKNIDALCLDKNLMAYLPKGITIGQYKKQHMEKYRDGISTLTAEQFQKYRDGDSAKVVNTELLKTEFFKEDDGQYEKLSELMEASLSFDSLMSEDMIALRARLSYLLPKFYINFDRKIFMHMVRGRSYESVVLDGWWGAECDFEHMIPVAYRYWVRDKMEDFWAVTNFSNFD